ncbi:interleukin-6 receptor subunit beta-like isoform X2 [Engraulis encrasicolus]|uniref:interleukin-6 receptor subunit beta-like isoform X2 n=1 Tax=Engraulis encrasicolus TaxID=184585 RepID=UPI002FD2E4CD
MRRFGHTTVFYLGCVFFTVVCLGHAAEICEVAPKDLMVEFGSNVTVVFKAPTSGICRTKFSDFSLSEVYWTLNNQRVDERFYDHNDTHATVTIANFSLHGKPTVECHMRDQVLGGTIVRTHDVGMGMEPPKEPANISCATRFLSPSYTTCRWDGAGNPTGTHYVVTMNKAKKLRYCHPPAGHGHACQFNNATGKSGNMTITVHASNAAGNASTTVHFEVWKTIKFDRPSLRVDPHPNRITVSSRTESCPISKDWCHCGRETMRCEVKYQYMEKGSIHTSLSEGNAAVDIFDIKPCTNYSVKMRCQCGGSLFSDWSVDQPVLSFLNVSTVPLYLWSKVLERIGNGSRLVQLMWKGPSPECMAFDEYRLSVDSILIKSKMPPTEKHATVSLSGSAHEIMIGVHRDNAMLHHSLFKIPSIDEELNPVLRPVANAVNEVISISWEPPLTPADGYVVEWFTEAAQQGTPFWEKTAYANISIAGVPSKLYTVTISPLYDKGPGPGTILYTYAKEAGRTVDHPHHELKLPDLEPDTSYSVVVRAHSSAGFSDSDPSHFTTEAYSKALIRILVSVAGGVVIVLICGVCLFILWKRMNNLMVPSPQYSSMAMWSQEKPLKPLFSNNLDMNSNPRERILTCQIEDEMADCHTFAAVADIDSSSAAAAASSCGVEEDPSPSPPPADSRSGSGSGSIGDLPAENMGLNPSYGMWRARGAESPEQEEEDQDMGYQQQGLDVAYPQQDHDQDVAYCDHYKEQQCQQHPLGEPSGTASPVELLQPYRDQMPAVVMVAAVSVSGDSEGASGGDEGCVLVTPEEEADRPSTAMGTDLPVPASYVSVDDVFEGYTDKWEHWK